MCQLRVTDTIVLLQLAFFSPTSPNNHGSRTFLGERNNAGKSLALEQLERRATASADMAELVLRLVLGNDGRSVTATDDDNGAVLGSLDVGVEESLGATSECGELEDTRGTERGVKHQSLEQVWCYSPVPEDGLGLEDRLRVELAGLGASVQAHPALGNTLTVGRGASLNLVVSRELR